MLEKLKELKLHLRQIADQGIEVDRHQVKKNMCAQFSDYHEWIREYAVNSSDAGASECRISGFEDKDTITMVLKDNGRGMNKKGVADFFTLYRSNKGLPAGQTVGRHGIGKLSIAAIPGQSAFEMTTSTGEECWVASAGSLLEEETIKIRRILPVEPPGTEFRITFRKSVQLEKELEIMKEILGKYVTFLKCRIIMDLPTADSDPISRFPCMINQEWPGNNLLYSNDYFEEVGGSRFRITLGLGRQQQLIFQNKVFITGKYNLLSHDLHESWDIPALSVMVDSPDFELPFGRHCLSNEDILIKLAQYIRSRLLPLFYREILQMYSSGFLKDSGFSDYSFEIMTSHLMWFDKFARGPWFDTPIFRTVSKKLISFNELDEMIKKSGKLYLAPNDNAGADYSVFDGPVLSNGQNGCCAELVKHHFRKFIIDLNDYSLVFEKPGIKRSNLSEAELTFENNLGFHPYLFDLLQRGESADDSEKENYLSIMHDNTPVDGNGISKESLQAKSELEDIRWKINYLVGRDGVTQSTTHLYLFTGSEVILNLNHPDIKQLVALSVRNPGLAAHWAMAICLLSEQNILPHATPATREDILMLDAMMRIRDSRTTFMNSLTGFNTTMKSIIRNLSNMDLN